MWFQLVTHHGQWVKVTAYIYILAHTSASKIAFHRQNAVKYIFFKVFFAVKVVSVTQQILFVSKCKLYFSVCKFSIYFDLLSDFVNCFGSMDSMSLFILQNDFLGLADVGPVLDPLADVLRDLLATLHLPNSSNTITCNAW